MEGARGTGTQASWESRGQPLWAREEGARGFWPPGFSLGAPPGKLHPRAQRRGDPGVPPVLGQRQPRN